MSAHVCYTEVFTVYVIHNTLEYILFLWAVVQLFCLSVRLTLEVNHA